MTIMQATQQVQSERRVGGASANLEPGHERIAHVREVEWISRARDEIGDGLVDRYNVSALEVLAVHSLQK